MEAVTNQWYGTITLKVNCIADSEDEMIEKTLRDAEIMSMDVEPYQFLDDNGDEQYDYMKDEGLL